MTSWLSDAARPIGRTVSRLDAFFARTGLLDAVSLLLLLIFLVFVLPARAVMPGVGAVGRPALLVALGLLVLWVFARAAGAPLSVGRQPLRVAAAVYLMAFLFAYGLGYARGLTSIEASSSDRGILTLLGLLGTLLVVADGVPTMKALNRVLAGLVGGGAFMAIVAVLQSQLGLDLVPRLIVPPLEVNGSLLGVSSRGLSRVAGTAGHYIELGVVMAMLTPLAMHFALTAPRKRSRQLWALATGLIAWAALLSISRSAIVSMIVGFLVLLPAWSWRGRFNALVVAVGFLVLVRVAQPGLLGTLRSLFSYLDSDPSVQGRTSDYPVVLGYVSDRPLFGRGPGTFVPEKYLFLDNQMLGTLVETGLLGLAALLGLIVTAMVLALRVARWGPTPPDRHLGYSLTSAIAAASVSLLTFDALGFATFASVFFLLLGAAGALWRLAGRPSRHRSEHRLRDAPAPGSPADVPEGPTGVSRRARGAAV